MKTKTKPHGNEVIDFYDKKYPTLDPNYTCLAAIGLDSALKKDDNYYPQVFLIECKYIDKNWLGIFMLIWVIFLILLMSLRKNSCEVTIF